MQGKNLLQIPNLHKFAAKVQQKMQMRKFFNSFLVYKQLCCDSVFLYEQVCKSIKMHVMQHKTIENDIVHLHTCDFLCNFVRILNNY